MTLTDSQYKALIALYNECNNDFWLISEETQAAFFDRLFKVSTQQVYLIPAQIRNAEAAK